MRKIKWISPVILSMIFFTMLFSNNTVVQAMEGGVVQTKGEVVFSEENKGKPTPSEPTVSSTTDSKTRSSSTDAPVVKPSGKYPSTGELVKTSLSISGITLIILAGILFLIRRKKRAENEVAKK